MPINAAALTLEDVLQAFQYPVETKVDEVPLSSWLNLLARCQHEMFQVCPPFRFSMERNFRACMMISYEALLFHVLGHYIYKRSIRGGGVRAI
jgi:hypothetical protein